MVGLVAVGSGCWHIRSSRSPVSDLLGMGKARLSAGNGDTEPLSPSPCSGTSSGRLPPAHALPDLGRPAAELLLISCLKQDVGGVGDLGDIGEGHGGFREREMCIPLPPTHPPMLGTPAGTAHPPPCTPHPPVHPLPGGEEELKFGTGAFGSHMCLRGWERPQGWLQTLSAAPTLRTKVWRLSGISRRVHLRTSCTVEQAMSSFGLEPCEGKHRARAEPLHPKTPPHTPLLYRVQEPPESQQPARKYPALQGNTPPARKYPVW